MESSHDIAEYRERRKFWRTVVAAAVCGGLALFSVGVYLLCRYVFPSDKISEFYTDKLFYYISWPIKKVIAYFPFSVAEIALYASIAVILFWFINMLVGTVRAGRRCYIRKKQNVPIEGFSLLQPLVQLVLRLSSFICVIVSAFVLFGGINYTSLTFSEKAGYELEEADVDQLSQLCRLLSARAAAARLTLQDVQLFGMKTVVPLGFVLALIAVFVMHFFINRTRQGFELKAVGASRSAAEYAGVSTKRTILMAMSLSGALAGLAGATYYLGYLGSIQPKVLTTTGFDAIAVCLLGNANPLGILASSFLITIITKGGTYMNSSIGVPQEVSSLITGLMLLFAACGVYIRARLKRVKDRLEQEEKEAKKEGGKA